MALDFLDTLPNPTCFCTTSPPHSNVDDAPNDLTESCVVDDDDPDTELRGTETTATPDAPVGA
jgi:hypothetical protein